LILDVVGTPTAEDVFGFVTNQKAQRFILKKEPKPKASYKKLYPRASSKALDLVEQLLQFTPSRRMSVQAALEHPYLVNYHGPDPVTHKVQNEPVAPTVFDFQEVETLELSKLSLQKFIMRQLD
jgi:mitogen-activated protein kinase 1/3